MALAWPVTSAQVQAWRDEAVTSDPSLDQVVEGVAAYVPTIPGLAAYWTNDEPPEFVPPADVILGAIMLAARWQARRGSVLGTTTGIPEFGAQLIMRYDPDIGRKLRLGSFAPFGFGAPSLPVEEA